MVTKKIKAWKASIAGDKNIFVSTNVKAIHPVVDKMVKHLLEINLTRYIRVSKNNIQASNDIMVRGHTKIPISTPEHPTVVGVHVLFGVHPNAVHFYEKTSAEKGNNTIEIATVLLYKDIHTERIRDLYGTETKQVLGNKDPEGDDEG